MRAAVDPGHLEPLSCIGMTNSHSSRAKINLANEIAVTFRPDSVEVVAASFLAAGSAISAFRFAVLVSLCDQRTHSNTRIVRPGAEHLTTRIGRLGTERLTNFTLSRGA